MRKALIIVPTFSGVLPRPFRNFMEIAYVTGRTCPDWKFGWWVEARTSLPAAMNGAAIAMLSQGYDALISFDDDCFPPYDCIPRLLKHYEEGREFVAGVGIMRNYPHTTTVAEVYDDGPTLKLTEEGAYRVEGHRWLDDIEALPPLADVGFCGVPVAMMARTIFERVRAPWFGLHGEDGGTLSHDVFFCRKLKEAGIPVLVDTTIRCGHLAEPPVVSFENRAQARELVDG